MVKKIASVGVASYSQLTPELQWDFAVGVTRALDREYGKEIPSGFSFGTPRVANALHSDDTEIEIVAVDPRRLKACVRMKGRYDTGTVEKYRKAYLRGTDFPPIVINSSLRNMLCEGYHRSCAAERAGVEEINALDVASIDLGVIAQRGDSLLFRE